jgi:hypothetical protein
LTSCTLLAGATQIATNSITIEGGTEGSRDSITINAGVTAAQSAGGVLSVSCRVNSGDPDFDVDELQLTAVEVGTLSVQ